MKIIIFILAVCGLLFGNLAFAEKPAWAGKGKPSMEQRQEHKATMNAKGDDNQQRENPDWDLDDEKKKQNKALKKQQKKETKQLREKKNTEQMEKLREQKSVQEQKELGKGSEEGQKSRETRKKWWHFGL